MASTTTTSQGTVSLEDARRVTAAADIVVGGVSYPAVNYRVGDQTLTVAFDPAMGLPARVRTLDYDSIWGDVTYDLLLSDWQTVDGVKVAMTRKFELNGRPVTEMKLTEVKLNAPIAADRFAIPAAFKDGAPKAATGAGPLTAARCWQP